MHLAVADRSFDRVHCLEAAFHFPDRRRFLREASRVLRDGGRAVVVDFAWKTAQGRSCRDEESTRLVRQIWQWDDLFSVDEYKQAAQEAGFDLERCLDWTRCVAAPLQLMFEIVAWLGLRGWGRRLLVSTNPLLRRMSTAEWQDLAASARAHHDSRRHTRYIALVLRKPPASGTTPGN
jgi:SAM-dependent methyltransferase